ASPLPPLSFFLFFGGCGGGFIAVDYDAHKIGQIGTTIKQGQELLKEAGFQYITIFENRKPSFKKI
ncbi:hypothetical protein CG709_04585, partial [Lachnotalea glycerini]